MPAVELSPFTLMFRSSDSCSYEPFNYEAVLAWKMFFIEAGKGKRDKYSVASGRNTTIKW